MRYVNQSSSFPRFCMAKQETGLLEIVVKFEWMLSAGEIILSGLYLRSTSKASPMQISICTRGKLCVFCHQQQTTIDMYGSSLVEDFWVTLLHSEHLPIRQYIPEALLCLAREARSTVSLS